MTEAMAYGSWPSPVTADLVVGRSVGLGELAVGEDDVWWTEQRPDEAGRVVIVRHRPDGGAVDVLPPGFSARTRVHEYGGGAWWLHGDLVFFVNWADQRLYRLDPGVPPRPLTPEPARPQGARYADGRVTVDSRWILCVREVHADDTGAGSTSPVEPRNQIVAVDAHDGGEPVVLVDGPDFVAAPRPSPDGRHLCWLQWNHPAMPWDAAELWVGDLVDDADIIAVERPRRVAGGSDEAIVQPEWGPDASLWFVSDRSDWWNLYRVPADVVASATSGPPIAQPLAPVAGDIGLPAWVFGQSRYALLSDGRVLCAYAADGIDHLGLISADGLTFTTVDAPFTTVASVHAFGDGAVVLGASPVLEPSVAALDLLAGPSTGVVATALLRPPRDLGLDPGIFSVPRTLTFPTTDGAAAHALYYPPTHPGVEGPVGERPPLVVVSHGGPTAAARAQLSLALQFWTSRGFAVVDVNYRGSSGFGRRYRQALDGRWGIADVDDCIAAARHLVDLGYVDGDRLVIRGASAGGFTTLCALTFHDVFTVGVSLYGVADLEALAADTHKFEARYLDTLVGPWPDAREVYRARSPIHHTDGLNCPLLLLQGLEDVIVPPAQAELVVGVLREKGLPFAYVAFEGEQHGFRQAATIKRALEVELYVLSRVLGFEPADEIDPVPIENL